MIAMPQNQTRSRVTHCTSATKSTARLPSPMKASAMLPLVYLLLAISDASVVGVMGFAITTFPQTVGRVTSLGLVSISQDIATAPYPPSSSLQQSLLSSTTTQVHRGIVQKIEETALLDSRFSPSLSPSPSVSTTALLAFRPSENDGPDIANNNKNIGTNKRNFFESLDTMESLNGATKERSALLAKMIDEKQDIAVGEKGKEESSLSSASASTSTVPTVSYKNPGSTETFLSSGAAVAEGSWKVVYAPHMTTAMNLFRGRFDVAYDLFPDSRIVSHAYYDFPVVGKGYLSVSGTYGSKANDATNTYSRVDFDRAWIKALPSSSTSTSIAAPTPYESLDVVPDSFLKTIINEIGKRAFIESVAVFPVSFLDDDTIVFEFETLGTKICARKV